MVNTPNETRPTTPPFICLNMETAAEDLFAAAYLPSVPRRLILEFAAFRHSIWTPRCHWLEGRKGRTPSEAKESNKLVCLQFRTFGSALHFRWCEARRTFGGCIETLYPVLPCSEVDPSWLKIKIFSSFASVTLFSPLYDRLVRFTPVRGHRYLKCSPIGARMLVSGTWAYSLSMLEGTFVDAVQIIVEQMAPNDVERLRTFVGV